MVKKLNDVKNMLKVYIGISIIMHFSLFTANGKIVATSMLLWIIATGWTLYLSTGRYFSANEFATQVIRKTEQTKKEKKYFQHSIYMLVIPLVAIGLIMVILNILVLFLYM